MAHSNKGGAKTFEILLTLDDPTWQSLLKNEPLSNPNQTKTLEISSGKVKILVGRHGDEDLLLRATFEPFESRLSAVAVKISLDLTFPQGSNVQQKSVEIKDKLTHIIQGDSGTALLFIPLAWSSLPKDSPSPSINLSITEAEDSVSHWMGVLSVKPRATFHIDLNHPRLPSTQSTSVLPTTKLEDVLKVWKCIVQRTYGTWWLWLPPLEISSTPSSSSSNSHSHGVMHKLGKTLKLTHDTHAGGDGQSTWLVAYAMRHEEVNRSSTPPQQEYHLLIKGSLYHSSKSDSSHSHKTDPSQKSIKVLQSELCVREKESQKLISYSSQLAPDTIGDKEKEAAHYDKIARFVLKKEEWNQIDPLFAPRISLTIEEY